LSKEEIGITASKKDDFSDWYTQVVLKAELADYAPVKGLIVLRPDGNSIWESIKKLLNEKFSQLGKALLSQLRDIELTLVIGQYAQAYHLGANRRSLTEIVRSWREYWPALVPLPHPSPRNRGWLQRNPWFRDEILPALRQRVGELLYL